MILHSPGAHIAVYAALFMLAAWLAWRRPVLGLALLLIVAPASFAYPVGHTTVTLIKVALVGVAAGFLFGKKSFSVLRDRRAQLVLAATFLVLACTALTFTQAAFKEPAIRETLKSAEYLFALVLALVCYGADPDDDVLRCAIFGVAAVVSLLALAQEFGGAPSAIFVRGHVVARIAGPMEGPNQLSGYLGLLFPVALAFALRGRAGLLGWVSIALSIGALVLTFSRAGALCAVVAVAIVFAFDRRRGNLRAGYAVGALAVAAGAAALLVGGELSRFWSAGSNAAPNGLGTRGDLWTAAWRLWQRHPWLGIGAGNYEMELSWAGYPELRTHANSGYLQTLTEQGIPGLLALLWLTWLSLSTFIRARVQVPLALGALGAMAGMALHEFFDDLMFFSKDGLTFFLLLGAGCAAITVANQASRKSAANAH